MSVGRLGQNFSQVEQALAHRRNLNSVIGPHQLQRFLVRHGAVCQFFLTSVRHAPIQLSLVGTDLIRQFLEEISDRRVQNTRKLIKPTGANAVRAALIFLNLLERQADFVTQALL